MSDLPGNAESRSGDAARVCAALLVISVGLMIPVEFWPAHGVLMVGVFVALTLRTVPLRYLGRRLVLFLPLVASVSLSIPLVHGFQAGWELACTLLVRMLLAFLVAMWLINAVPFDRMIAVLARLGCPGLLLATLTLMHRYVGVLWREFQMLQTARRARFGASAGLMQRWRSLCHVLGMLLIRSLNRAERTHLAMKARGWNGNTRALRS